MSPFKYKQKAVFSLISNEKLNFDTPSEFENAARKNP